LFDLSLAAKSYVCETGKSMKAVELTIWQRGWWRKIAITLIETDWFRGKVGEQTAQACANVCFEQLTETDAVMR
jgi:hypothetical protein